MDKNSSEDEVSSSEESHDSDTLHSDSEELSIEQLLEMREKLGSKAFNKKLAERQKMMKKSTSESEEKHETLTKSKDGAKPKGFGRDNKNRPQEMSSKRPVRKLRKTGHAASAETRDPRFDDLCGSKFNEEVFDSRFSFLSDIRSKEKRVLTRKLRRTKNPDHRKNLKFLIQRMDNQEREKNRKREEKQVIQKWRAEEKSKVAQGKKPYFLKQSDKRKLIQEHRRQKRSDKKKNASKAGPQSSKRKRNENV